MLYLLDGRRTSPPSDAGTPQMLRYLRESLGYRTDLPYLGLEDLTQGFAPSGTYPKERRRAMELCYRAHDCR